MSVDRRLHHAARELRAVDVPIPPLGMPSSHHRPRVTTLVGGLALLIILTGASIGLLRAGTSTSQEPTAAVASTAPSVFSEDRVVVVDVVMNPREEIAIIERLGAESSGARDRSSRPTRRGVI